MTQRDSDRIRIRLGFGASEPAHQMLAGIPDEDARRSLAMTLINLGALVATREPGEMELSFIRPDSAAESQQTSLAPTRRSKPAQSGAPAYRPGSEATRSFLSGVPGEVF